MLLEIGRAIPVGTGSKTGKLTNTRETRLGIGVGRCSIELVDCISCDCVNDFKAALANAVNGAIETKKHLKEFGGMSIFPATLPLILWDNKPTISASQA
jgi:hypothetical protein